MRKAIPACLFSVLLLISCASQDKVDIISFVSAPLFGMIYDDDNQPCANAKLIIDGQQGPVTDIRGRFLLPDLSRGGHTLVVQKEGFEELTVNFEFLNKTDVLYLKTISFPQLLKMAERALEDRKWAEADAYLVRAEKLNPGDTVFLYLRAVQAYKTEKFPEAVGYLNAIIEKGARDAYVYLFLADLYEINLKDRQKAIENLELYLSKRADAEAQKRLDTLKAAAGN
jgi:tetratricopeptide (TPR) repeat protein